MNAVHGHRTCECTLKPHDVSKVTSVYCATKFTTCCLLITSINKKLTQLRTLLCLKLHVCRVVSHRIMMGALPFEWLCFTKLAWELAHMKGCAHQTGMELAYMKWCDSPNWHENLPIGRVTPHKIVVGRPCRGLCLTTLERELSHMKKLCHNKPACELSHLEGRA